MFKNSLTLMPSEYIEPEIVRPSCIKCKNHKHMCMQCLFDYNETYSMRNCCSCRLGLDCNGVPRHLSDCRLNLICLSAYRYFQDPNNHVTITDPVLAQILADIYEGLPESLPTPEMINLFIYEFSILERFDKLTEREINDILEHGYKYSY